MKRGARRRFRKDAHNIETLPKRTLEKQGEGPSAPPATRLRSAYPHEKSLPPPDPEEVRATGGVPSGSGAPYACRVMRPSARATAHPMLAPTPSFTASGTMNGTTAASSAGTRSMGPTTMSWKVPQA